VIQPGYQRAGGAVLWGTILGAAAWSAYAAAEVVFASLLFGFTRPYAVFQPWHWRLTGYLLTAYLVAGAAAGAAGGLAAYHLGKTGWIRNGSPAVLEAAAALTLVGVVLWNVTANALGLTGGVPVLITGLCFLVLLLVELRSERWADRLGMLTNPWVISGVLLGVEQTADLLDMASGQQLGGNVGLAARLLEGALVVTVAGAVWFGRKLRPILGPARWAPATLALALVLIGVTELMGTAHLTPTAVSADSAAAAQTPGSKPNVLVIVMDTVRADHLSLYGYERDTSPNLRALAQEAAVYTHAQSAADITLTSHASLFTGMYPSWHGAYCRTPEAAYGRPLLANVPTLAELLHGQGYSTLGVAANLYLRSAFGLDRGFEEFRIERPVPMLSDENRCQLRRPMRRLLNLVTDTAQFDRLNSSAEDIDGQFLATLDGRGRPDAPFFGFVNYMDAHFPYIPPAPWDRKFPGKVSTLTKDYLEGEQYTISSGSDTPTDYRRYCISQYDGGIAYVDAQIGRILTGLKRRNLYDNTMIVVTSDHGEAFGERHRVEHGNSPYQNLLHVALLIKYPKSAHRGPVEAPVSLIDVAPTVLAVAGIPAPGTMQGRSLLEGTAKSTRLFSETFACQVIQSVECPGCAARAMVEWPFKYIVLSTGKRELFHLDSDPDETREISAADQGNLTALAQTVTAWGKTIPVQRVQQMKLSPAETKALKSLGYVGGGGK